MKRVFIYCILILYCSMAHAQRSLYPKPKHYCSSDTMLARLNSYPLNTMGGGIYPWAFSTSINVTDTIKRKLIAMLKPFVWTDSLIKSKVEEHLKNNSFSREFEWRFWDLDLKDSIIDLARKNGWYFDSTYHKIYDSLEIVYKKNIEKEIRSTIVMIPDVVLLCAARVRVKEAVPLLKNDLASNTHYYNPEIAKIALAALGDIYYKREVFQKHKEFVAKKYWDERDASIDFITMRLINTQESIGLLADWMDTTRTFKDDPYCTTCTPFYFSGKFIGSLLFQDSAFKEGFLQQPMLPGIEGEIEYHYSYITKEQIQYVKEWMLRNKGKYDID